MRNFSCVCGQRLFFENTRCMSCQRRLGYDPVTAAMLSLEPQHASNESRNSRWRAAQNGRLYRLCRNEIEHHLCNWLVSSHHDSYCLACALNETVPDVSSGSHSQTSKRRWFVMEQAKKRLLYTLLALGLPVRGKREDSLAGLGFAFLEDQRSNPLSAQTHVLTGHLKGLITVNLAEADELVRERVRQEFGERYRTLLGHLRHESGHYYFQQLLCTEMDLQAFRVLFGDERVDYEKALNAYYSSKRIAHRSADMISPYAGVHPLEDWAECWAHYLHMIDTLETASAFGMSKLLRDGISPEIDIETCFREWERVSVCLNALNRSMGKSDAYPFVLSAPSINKLRFVHQRIYPSLQPRQMEASA